VKKVFKVKEVCQNCGGTGLYRGMGEGEGAAVVCHTCDGTGCHDFEHSYEEFERRKEKRGVERVFLCNPGIGIGKGPTKEGQMLSLSDFGGMPYKEWAAGMKFPKGHEMRKYTCPAWYYQSADYKKKPDWKECNETLGGYISDCKHFKCKAECWVRWDKENGNKKLK